MTVIDSSATIPTATIVDPETLLRATQAAFAEWLGLTDDGGLRATESYVYPGLDTYSFALPDLLLTNDFEWCATEVNGPNGAGTSAHSGDLERVKHEVDTLMARGMDPGAGDVFIRALSPDTRSGPEIVLRSALLAAVLEPRIGKRPKNVSTAMPVDPTTFSIVTDTIPAIVEYLELRDGNLLYRGARVVMNTNQNLISALARALKMPLAKVLDAIPEQILHDGRRMTEIGFDKVRQQEIATGTLMRPLAARLVIDGEDTAVAAVGFADAHGGCCLKPLTASGGTAVIAVPPGAHIEEIRAAIAQAESDLDRKYGSDWRLTSPWSMFEFAYAKPALGLDGLPRRWDMRLEVLVTPTATVITPLSARLCPAPAVGRLTRENSVSNQTGREKHAAEALDPFELCRRVGIAPSALRGAADAAFSWMQSALR